MWVCGDSNRKDVICSEHFPERERDRGWTLWVMSGSRVPFKAATWSGSHNYTRGIFKLGSIKLCSAPESASTCARWEKFQVFIFCWNHQSGNWGTVHFTHQYLRFYRQAFFWPDLTGINKMSFSCHGINTHLDCLFLCSEGTKQPWLSCISCSSISLNSLPSPLSSGVTLPKVRIVQSRALLKDSDNS